MERNIKLIIEFDGTDYHGWQSQINASTVQDKLEKAIKKLTAVETKLYGCGRTDAGVHALNYVANFKTSISIPSGKIAYALNSLLPEDIVVKESLDVEESFNARFSAKSKKYRYSLYNSKFPSPLLRNRAMHVNYTLDVDAMAEAANHYIGTYEFTSFKASGSNQISDIRTMIDASVTKRDEIINFDILGTGFLYNMVRIMTGTLLSVGRGKLKPEEITKIIELKDRKKAGKTLPPHGLYLIEVNY